MQAEETTKIFQVTTPMDVKSEMKKLENLAARDPHVVLDLELLEEFGNFVSDLGHTRGRGKQYLQVLFLY